MSNPIGTDERLDRIEELEARIEELTELCALEYQRAWLLETQKNIAEEKLAQQDDLVQAAVATREAQKAYFKDRSRDNLIASKQAEAALDKMLAVIRKGGE